MNVANAYKNQQIMTASPEELTLMLYNGAILYITESIKYLEQNELEKSHNANLRTQDIIKEFMSTLDMNYEISQNLFSLYEYMNYRLMQGNMKKDKLQLEEVKGMLLELRDTWKEAMKKVRVARVGS